MADYPTEVSDYLKQKYDNAALGDLGQTQINSALAHGAGQATPAPTTTDTDLVKHEINNYLGIGKGSPAKKYTEYPGVVGPNGEAVLLNQETGEFGNIKDGKWTPVAAKPLNKHEEISPIEQAKLALDERKVAAAEAKSDALAKGIGGISSGLQYRMDRDAKLDAQKEEDKRKAEEDPKTNQDQGKAAGFASAMDRSNNIFDDLEKSGYNRAGIGSSLTNLLPSALAPEDLKRQNQAEKTFINATLRRDSGAAINKQEYEDAADRFFPRAGDPPSVLAQKKADRLAEQQALEAAAGPAAKKIQKIQARSNPGDSNSTPPPDNTTITKPSWAK